MKKIICVLLSLIVCMSMAMPTFANEDIKTEIMSPAIDVDAYAYKIIDAYIAMNIPHRSENDSFSLSQGFIVDGKTDKNSRTYFLFMNNKCIGQLNATYLSGEYHSNFTLSDVPILTDAYANKKAISIVAVADSSYIISENDIFSLYGLDLEKNAVFNNYNSQKANSNSAFPIVLTNISCDTNSRSVLSGNGKCLSIPRVRHIGVPEQPGGICWTSVVSSISAYRTGSTRVYSTTELYYGLYNAYGQTQYPEGNELWIKRGYSFLNLTVQNYNGGLNYSGVRNLIDQDIPIHASINDTNANVAHGVAICGYQSVAGLGNFFVLMDPNVYSDYVTVSASSSAAVTDFVYSPSSTRTYDDWYRRFY